VPKAILQENCRKKNDVGMAKEDSTTTITVFTRHSAECPKTDPRWKRCSCRKSLYIYEGGKDIYKSARTRSWEAAERAAQAERDLRDPVKIKLLEIEAKKVRNAEAEAARESNKITIDQALDRWLKSHKQLSDSTGAMYRSFVRKVSSWATMKGMTYLSEVTPGMLDEWRGQWSRAARPKDDRMGDTTQSHFQVRLKNFFAWASGIGLIGINPALALKSIPMSTHRTMPLTPKQFEDLLAATGLYDAGRRSTQDKFGKDLRALFLVMRWSGLRIADASMMPRSAIVGNRLTLTTQKTKAPAALVLPDRVVEELTGCKPVHAPTQAISSGLGRADTGLSLPSGQNGYGNWDSIYTSLTRRNDECHSGATC
jgi:hypothetical protein